MPRTLLTFVFALNALGCGAIEYEDEAPQTLSYGETTAYPTAQAGGTVSISVFVRVLSPYGTWITLDQGQWAFLPNDPDYRPYRNGRWQDTDDGLAWVSYDEIGWAVCHYGRWMVLDDGRWAWIPDETWAPARVDWRDDDTYVGWAPQMIGPTPIASWTFVQAMDLFAWSVATIALAGADIETVYQQCRPRQWAHGPPARWQARRGLMARGARIRVRDDVRPRHHARGARVIRRSRTQPHLRARGAQIRRRTAEASARREPLGAGERGRRVWLPPETVVLDGQPVPERSAPGLVTLPPVQGHAARSSLGSPGGALRDVGSRASARTRPSFDPPPRARPGLGTPERAIPYRHRAHAPQVAQPQPHPFSPTYARPAAPPARAPMLLDPRVTQPSRGFIQPNPSFAPQPQPRFDATTPRFVAPPVAQPAPRFDPGPRIAPRFTQPTPRFDPQPAPRFTQPAPRFERPTPRIAPQPALPRHSTPPPTFSAPSTSRGPATQTTPRRDLPRAGSPRGPSRR